MTYFGFLFIFLGIPIALLSWLTYRDRQQQRTLPAALRNWQPGVALLAHILVALLYTTPWDNYLVATGVWWYDPALVTGIVIGWVPIEEYTFFIVQPIMAGLLLLWLARRLPLPHTPPANRPGLRRVALAAGGLLWLGSAGLLASGWPPGTYLGLILIWALPPIMLQLIFGADILWRYRRAVLPAVLLPTLYLSAADVLAISGGTWTISPEKSLNLLIGGILPIEELLFFLLTNTLITFGMTLALKVKSVERIPSKLRQRLGLKLRPENG